MQGCLDELIRDIGTIELGGIDVIDAEFRGAPQNRNRLAAVSRRPNTADLAAAWRRSLCVTRLPAPADGAARDWSLASSPPVAGIASANAMQQPGERLSPSSGDLRFGRAGRSALSG
jgi:hypothetical protein